MEFNISKLTNIKINSSVPSWLTDGKEIAFTSDSDGNNEIYVMNADGSNQIVLGNGERIEKWPCEHS